MNNDAEERFALDIHTPSKLNIPEPRQKADIYLIGAGISFPEHLTFEAVSVIKKCNKVFTNLLDQEIALMPQDLAEKCSCVWGAYQKDRERSLNYEDISSMILDEVIADRPVAWLTIGHPVVFDSVSQNIIERTRDSRYSVEILPAISSIDSVLAQLGYDCANGLLVYEATSLVEAAIPLHNYFALLLLQPSAFNSSATNYSGTWRPDLRMLFDYLLNFYPPGHVCAFVRTFSGQSGPSSVVWMKLEQAHEVEFSHLAGSTLFVPPHLG